MAGTKILAKEKIKLKNISNKSISRTTSLLRPYLEATQPAMRLHAQPARSESKTQQGIREWSQFFHLLFAIAPDQDVFTPVAIHRLGCQARVTMGMMPLGIKASSILSSANACWSSL